MMMDDTSQVEAEDAPLVGDDLDLVEGVAPQDDLYEELLSRCKSAGIEVQTRTYEELDAIYTDLALPSGRQKRWVSVSGDRLPAILKVEFEKFVFLSGYEAICSYRDGFIEASLRGAPASAQFAIRRILRSMPNGGEGEQIVVDPPAEIGDRPTIKIGVASEEFSALSSGPGMRRITIRLDGLKVSNHDQACAELLKYSNSFMFQLDMFYGTSFILERERVRRSRPFRRNQDAIVQYPVNEYDSAPMSLYWYAKSSRGMPLLQFLAFYQCVEFYFPTFSHSEARRKIGLLLKDPTFRVDKESDIARLLSTISVGRSGGVGDERSQLRATISECLNPEELRSFFEDDKERAEYFSGKQKKPGVHKLPLANQSVDLRNDVADRIYNIRCKIVHTKDSDQHEGGMILPFSEEADFLIHDIELVEFVARKVLIATSSSLS